MSINKINFYFDHYNEEFLYMDKPLLEIIFFDDQNDLEVFLEKLDEDKVYVIIVEFISDYSKDTVESDVFLGPPFLISRKSNPWLISNYIKNQIDIKNISDNSIYLFRYQELNIS